MVALEEMFKKFVFFCTLNLIIRIFTIIYDVLQHYYDERCSPESWSLLLMSPLGETMEDPVHSDKPSKNKISVHF